MNQTDEQYDPPEAPKGSRYKSMIRDTWWAWVILILFGLICGVLVSAIFYSAIPISFFAFFYFAIMRYDEEGNPTGD